MINLNRIEELSHRETKAISERFLKLSEECGELAQEILISNQVSGSQYKKASDDGSLGEAVDVIIVALSIFFKSGGAQEDLFRLFEKKCDKWEKWQK